MKVLAYVLSVLVVSALLIGGIVVLVTQVPDQSPGEILLSVFSISALVYGPLVLGSLTGYWDVRRSPEARRFFARWVWGVLAVEALAAVGLVVFAVIAGAPAWIPAVFVATSAVLTAVAAPFGRAIQRRDAALRPASAPWQPVAPAEVRGMVAKVVITFFATLLVGVVVLTLLFASSADDGPVIGEVILFAVEFAFFAAGMACILSSLPLNRRLRDSVSDDFGALRTYARVVLRGKDDDLDERQTAEAAKYAVLVALVLEFQLGYIGLLYTGLLLQQIQTVLTGSGELGMILIAVLVVVLVVFVPFSISRVRRARAYARANAGLLPRAEAAIA